METMSSDDSAERLRRYWDRNARSHDRQMRFFERALLGEHRTWVDSRATGAVLEVAVGTGLNLGYYRADVRLTGIGWSREMIERARRRAHDLGRAAELREGDAQALEFDDESFDTVVCTYSLCGIPDDRRAVAEMYRVLRPGGLLLLVDHVASDVPPVRLGQRVLELATVPLGGEHLTRRPVHLVRAAGFEVVEQDRSRLGIVERVAARKPAVR
jgi:ubiquinone/menaquinone biosynthesis C-methylase UbiE